MLNGNAGSYKDSTGNRAQQYEQRESSWKIIEKMSSEEHSFDLAEIRGLQLGLHSALAVFITLLVTLLAVKYEPVSVSPFEAHPTDMTLFMGFLSIYMSAMMAAIMMRGTTGSKGPGRRLAVALLLWHLSLISGFLASASLLFLLLPASFWWILMATLSLLLLIAAPCKPIQLFHSNIQQQYLSSPPRPPTFNRSDELADANTPPDLEKNLPDASVQGGPHGTPVRGL